MQCPLMNNLQVELVGICGIDFMGPFPKHRDDECMLVQVDYVSKWVEAISSQLQALQEDVPWSEIPKV